MQKLDLVYLTGSIDSHGLKNKSIQSMSPFFINDSRPTFGHSFSKYFDFT
jgi:hypothetical protein